MNDNLQSWQLLVQARALIQKAKRGAAQPSSLAADDREKKKKKEKPVELSAPYDETESLEPELTQKRLLVNIHKIDDEQRLVYGWASVYEKEGQPVVDKQGDRVSEAVILSTAHDFVSNARVAKAMHETKTTGDVVESLVLTRDIQKALGIDLNKAGWFVGMKIHDPATWQKVKTRELRTLSIGGKGVRTPVQEVVTQ